MDTEAAGKAPRNTLNGRNTILLADWLRERWMDMQHLSDADIAANAEAVLPFRVTAVNVSSMIDNAGLVRPQVGEFAGVPLEAFDDLAALVVGLADQVAKLSNKDRVEFPQSIGDAAARAFGRRGVQNPLPI